MRTKTGTKKTKVKLSPTKIRIVCPNCGNDTEFYEVADGVILTTRYIQNEDGSFTPVSDDSQVFGELKLYCGECNEDLTLFHKRFLEMLF